MKKIFLLSINHLVNKITNSISKLNVITSNFMLCPTNSPKLKHILYNEIKQKSRKSSNLMRWNQRWFATFA